MNEKSITFCINTARNERNHIELLFKSLYKNLSHRNYPIIVYVENDNQGTVEFLKTQKEWFPNLKIIINPLPIPLGYARNINLMFEMAQTEIVSYLQSDMVICEFYDLEVAKHLREDNIISSTRIEPPLHPPSPEKITHDFGLDPTKFDLHGFTEFANRCKQDRITNFWFAPFTLYKKHWIDIGGHDTLFRRSREDSDLLYRFTMRGVKIEQAWNALVYHFTCTSSRGPEWWTEKAQTRTRLQQQADMVELTRFLRKWPKFKHDTIFDPKTEYKYPISVNFYNVEPRDLRNIFNNYYKFHHIYCQDAKDDNKGAALYFTYESYKTLHDPANFLLSISPYEWSQYKKYYRTWEYDDIFVSEPITTDDVILNIDCATMNLFEDPAFAVLNDVLHEMYDEGRYVTGAYEFGTGHLIINKLHNAITDNIIVKNPPIDDINFTIL